MKILVAIIFALALSMPAYADGARGGPDGPGFGPGGRFGPGPFGFGGPFGGKPGGPPGDKPGGGLPDKAPDPPDKAPDPPDKAPDAPDVAGVIGGIDPGTWLSGEIRHPCWTTINPENNLFEC